MIPAFSGRKHSQELCCMSLFSPTHGGRQSRDHVHDHDHAHDHALGHVRAHADVYSFESTYEDCAIW